MAVPGGFWDLGVRGKSAENDVQFLFFFFFLNFFLVFFFFVVGFVIH